MLPWGEERKRETCQLLLILVFFLSLRSSMDRMCVFCVETERVMVRGHLPVSLEYIIGGWEPLSLKRRMFGYLFLLNKCKTKQINPANTAIPVVTPSNVGKSEVNVAISA